DAYIAYEGSYSDGPFINPGQYRRDNVNANYTKSLDATQKLGFRFLSGRNDFYSSGQIPLDLVSAGLLDRFGYVDPSDGGRVTLGTFSSYYSKSLSNGDTFKADAFLGRSCSTCIPISRTFSTIPCTVMPSSSTIPVFRKARMRSTRTYTRSERSQLRLLPGSIF